MNELEEKLSKMIKITSFAQFCGKIYEKQNVFGSKGTIINPNLMMSSNYTTYYAAVDALLGIYYADIWYAK